ncbi:MAG: hypothetical protein FWD15_00495 [Alphaproteobacteria bacterium]|nr:hypothetical protein [Alphaproteobacteria bacterium]
MKALIFILAIFFTLDAKAYIPENYIGFERRAEKFAITGEWIEEMDTDASVNGIHAGVRFVNNWGAAFTFFIPSKIRPSGGDISEFKYMAYEASVMHFFGGIYNFDLFAGVSGGLAGYSFNSGEKKEDFYWGLFAGVDYGFSNGFVLRATVGRKTYSGDILEPSGFISGSLLYRF